VPPNVTLAPGHQIKCHLPAEVLNRMQPVITVAAE
jgi:peptide/nickel transport system ATP-binding protein